MSDSERITALEARLAQLEARVVALEAARGTTYTISYPTWTGGGFQCAVCKTWVPLGTVHYCSGGGTHT